MSGTQTTDVTSSDAETYNSSSLARFAWRADPFGDSGFLHVVFQSGERYVYIGVEEELADSLRERAYEPDNFELSVGEFFHRNVRNEFRRRNEDYQKL